MRTPDAEKHRLNTLPPAGYYIPNFVTKQEEEYLLQKISETPKPKWKTVGSGRRLQYLGGTLTKKNALIPEPLPAWVTSFPDLIERITQITDVFQAAPTTTSEGSFDGSTMDEKSIDTLAEVREGEGAGVRSAESKAGGGQGRVVVKREVPNQLLINEYKAGQGISPHEDGAAYHPAVATISLGSSQTLDIFQYLSHTTPSPPLTATASPPSDPPSQKGKYVSYPLAPPKAATTSPTQNQPFNEIGKPIATVPMARLFLEPRSLFIMSSALYRTHLHGISETLTDVITAPAGLEPDANHAPGGIVGSQPLAVRSTDISNAQLLGDEELKQALLIGETVERARSTRTSLTFRRVQKVVNVALLGRGAGLGKLGSR